MNLTGIASFKPDRRDWIGLALAVVVLLALRLPFLPATFGDIDGVNFDLGVHDFNPTAHRPHPPGAPVFILIAKALHPLFESHAMGIAFLSALFSSLAVIPLYFLFCVVASRRVAAFAAILTLVNPLLWFNSVRPMSDLTGFFMVLTGQALLVTGASRLADGGPYAARFWYAGVIVSGLAPGVRIQALFLLGPVLLFSWFRFRSIRLGTIWRFAGAVALWLVPLLILSGGPAAYVQSLSRLLSEALPLESLLAAPSLRRAAFALWDVAAAPWGPSWLAVSVLFTAAMGGAALAASNRRMLGWILLLALPYATYHFLFQMTETTRYAIPLTPFVALLAAIGLTASVRLPRTVATAAGVMLVTASAAITIPALAAYHATASPAAQALAYVQQNREDRDFVVAGHYVFARHLSALGPEFDVLRSRPGKVWDVLAEYWKEGGRKPILFFKDPSRITLRRMSREARTTLGQWTWPLSVRPFMKGERPSVVELVRLEPPRWFSGGGLFLTPEAGPPAEVARRQHLAYLRASPRPSMLMASGVRLQTPSAPLTLRVNGDPVESHLVNEGQSFVLRAVLDPQAEADYLQLSLESSAPALFTDFVVAVDDQPTIIPARGFFMTERDKEMRQFRWIGPSAEAVVYAPGDDVRLFLRGQIPAKIYGASVTLDLAWEGAPLASVPVTTSEFEVEVRLPGPARTDRLGTLTMTSSHQFVPDERHRNGDKRNLAIQIYDLRVSQARPER